MSRSGNCRNCGAPLAPGLEECTYCGVHRRPERPGEFGVRSHAWFWAGLVGVSIATAVVGLDHLRRGDLATEGRDWALLFGVIPAFLLPVAAFWGPRKGRWGSLVFTVIPGLALVAAMAVGGELHDVDMLGYPAVSVAACFVSTLLGFGIHEWIVRVRAP